MTDKDQHSHEDLGGARAIERLREIAKAADTAMFITQHEEFPLMARPMAVQEVDEEGTLWFLSASDSDKNQDLQRDPRVTLLFQNHDRYEYLQLSGRARIHRDRALIDKHWTRFAEAWFDGKDDPRVTVIAVHPDTGHYWATENGKIVASAKMLLGAMGANVSHPGVAGELRM